MVYKIHKSRGFTLIELLIVVGLLALITSALVPGFAGYIDNQALRQTQEQIKSDIKSLQNKALTETNNGDISVKYWGLKIAASNATGYQFFTSATNDTAACNTSANQGNSEKFPRDIILRVSSVPLCVFFNLENGDATFAGTFNACTGLTNVTKCFVIGYLKATGVNCKNVGLNPSGLVKIGNEKVSCT